MRDECLKKWVYVEKDDGGDRFLNGADLGCGYPSGKPSDLTCIVPLSPSPPPPPPPPPPPLPLYHFYSFRAVQSLKNLALLGGGAGGELAVMCLSGKITHNIEIS